MKTMTRTHTATGTQYHFFGSYERFIDADIKPDKKPYLGPKFDDSHELVVIMRGLSDLFFDDPTETPTCKVGRMWRVNGKNLTEKPKKLFIDEDDEE